MATAFIDRLAAAVRERGSPVLVGLDPRWESLPAGLRAGGGTLHDRARAYVVFCNEVIDVVAPLVPAVKPQAAFFEKLGPLGMTALHEVINHARDKGLLVILDAKRNDIGSTAEAYADGMLGEASPWRADALTVSPYLGTDSLQPFVDVAVKRAAGIFVLVKTSNPGGATFQDVVVEGQPMYRRVADVVSRLGESSRGACGYSAVGAVVGATWPEQLAELRRALPHTWFLIPGYGAQGGSARDVAEGFDPRGLGAVVNNSRGIIFAYARKEYAQWAGGQWQRAVEEATRAMIDQLRQETPAGKLA